MSENCIKYKISIFEKIFIRFIFGLILFAEIYFPILIIYISITRKITFSILLESFMLMSITTLIFYILQLFAFNKYNIYKDRIEIKNNFIFNESIIFNNKGIQKIELTKKGFRYQYYSLLIISNNRIYKFIYYEIEEETLLLTKKYVNNFKPYPSNVKINRTKKIGLGILPVISLAIYIIVLINKFI